MFTAIKSIEILSVYAQKAKIAIFIHIIMTRRLKKQHLDIISKYELTDKERNFILGCIRCQKQYPQLTNKQWTIAMIIYERCLEYESESSKTSS